jgi:prephenate dehydrogenase
MIDKLIIVGCGLIGGSFARALRKANAVKHIVGYDVNQNEMREALRLGVVDEITDDLEAAAADADFIFIATPVSHIAPILKRVASVINWRCAVTDGGSTKVTLIARARLVMGKSFPNYVPGHPIAGRETSGVASSVADLFDGKNVVLTPVVDHAILNFPAVEAVKAAWAACGAKVVVMSAADHDKIFAAVSHLPHLLAFALVDEIAGRDNADIFFRFAASGFRDFTRIASSSPEMWRDIALQNRAALQVELAAFKAQISELQHLLNQPDAIAGPGLHALMSRAQHARKDWQMGQNIEPKA